MSTKLTLRLDNDLIRQAKKTAQSNGVSLSRIVEDYFKSLAVQKRKETPESPVLSEITGILSTKTGSKKFMAEYKKHLEEKYS